MAPKTEALKPYPLVSVVITTYNSSRDTLKRAIQSVTQQTYKSVELIVVDDASRVPFAGLDKDLLEERLTWIALTENKGVAAARNRGFSVSNGDYIAFLDHDDWWEPAKLQVQMALLENARLEWCYCGALYHDYSNEVINFDPKYEGYVYKDVLKNQVITGSVSSVLMTQSAFQSVNGFDESKWVIEDWDLWIRLSQKYDVGFSASALVNLGSSPEGSRSSDITGRLKRLRGTAQKHENALSKNNLKKYSDARYYRVRARLAFTSGQKYLAWSSWCIYFIKRPTWLALKWIVCLPFLRRK
jgi:glycosyltransferase involved in cell wall biosynthesis